VTFRAAVFASGGGSNFQALIDHARSGAEKSGVHDAGGDVDSAWEIVLLVTDRPDAGAIGRARAAGIETLVVPTKGRDAVEVGAELVAALEARRVDVVLLAGYLKLVPGELVTRWRGRILNIHPALLPDFGGHGMYGMRVHRAVLDSGASESGASVHFVDEEYDRGQVLAQRRVAVHPGDTPEDLAARVLEVEHRLYPEAVDNLCAALAAGVAPVAVLDARPYPDFA
jgi:formyltetrahydrofolate-dependent phosphoribosylglycinamide formyltransferase